jgi:hypothetical protein
MIVGLDIGLKAVGMASIDWLNNLKVLSDTKINLSVKSTLNEIVSTAYSICVHIPTKSTLLIDATQYRYKARLGQTEQLHSLIGAIAAMSYCTVFRIEPKAIRKVYGLPARAEKSTCWNCLSRAVYEQVPDDASEHLLDAIVLADVYKRYKDQLELW